MVKVVAHRGCSAKYPENTLLAFRKAVALGVEMVELDVIPSSDGEIMVIHDQTVDRTTDGTGRVAEMTCAEIRRLDAGSHNGAPGQRVPTLAEAIEAIGPDTEINVNFNFSENNLKEAREEAQLRAYEEAVVRIVNEAGAMPRSVFAIYPVAQIERVRALDPACTPVLLSMRDGAQYIRESVSLGLNVTQPSRNLMSREFVRDLHDAGLVGNVFYADTPEDMRSYIGMGIDGILTNEAELLMRVREEGVS